MPKTRLSVLNILPKFEAIAFSLPRRLYYEIRITHTICIFFQDVRAQSHQQVDQQSLGKFSLSRYQRLQMPLIAHTFGAYATYTNDVAKWRNSDHNVRMLVKAIKREEFRGYAKILDSAGRSIRFDFADPTGALLLFGDWAARRVGVLGPGPWVLVPVPSSRCTAFNQDTAPMRMAAAVYRASPKNTSIGTWLRFNAVMAASHDGGRRDQGILEAALISSGEGRGARVILVDDVKTTGAHARACANVLRRDGAIVDFILVAGATTQLPVDDPFNVPPVNLEF